MYAITFDLDTAALNHHYPNASPNNAYAQIGNYLRSQGFEWKQGSVYFGGPDVDAVACVLAVQHLARTYSWFGPAVRDIRMLRIEDNNDLAPAIDAVTPASPATAAATN